MDNRIFISGQIGLTPASLTLPSPPSLGYEMALATQHVERIIDVLSNKRVKWPDYTLAAIYWIANTSDLGAVKNAHEFYEEVRLGVQ